MRKVAEKGFLACFLLSFYAVTVFSPASGSIHEGLTEALGGEFPANYFPIPLLDPDEVVAQAQACIGNYKEMMSLSIFGHGCGW
ncbi:MAG: hypothetical protein AAGL23_05595 [Pseudomonadota bacterium]